jgi:hypothetical protein
MQSDNYYWKTEEGTNKLRKRLKEVNQELADAAHEFKRSRTGVVEEGGDPGGRVINDSISNLNAERCRIVEELERSRVCINTPEIRRASIRLGTCIVVEECVCNLDGTSEGETKECVKHIVGWREYYTNGNVTGIPYTTSMGEILVGCVEGETVVSRPLKGPPVRLHVKKLCADVDEALSFIKSDEVVAA